MDELFAVHRLNAQGLKKAEDIAAIFDSMLTALALHCPTGREWSLARTKLEEASFYAKKSMSMDPQNQADFAGYAPGNATTIIGGSKYSGQIDDRREFWQKPPKNL